MTEIEKEQYLEARQTYLDFKEQNISFKHSYGWQQFYVKRIKVLRAKKRLRSIFKAKKLSQSSENKFHYVWDIITKHKMIEFLIFTQDNETAYSIGRNFFCPF